MSQPPLTPTWALFSGVKNLMLPLETRLSSGLTSSKDFNPRSVPFHFSHVMSWWYSSPPSKYYITSIQHFKPIPSHSSIIQVYVSEHLVECGLAIFRHLRLVQWHALLDGNLSHEHLSCQLILRHDLAACYWTALKHCSIRTAVPNRSLMSKATATDPTTLGQREVDAMVTIEWEVNAVLRVVGLVQ